MPGSAYERFASVNDSLAMRKNHPPAHAITLFHTTPIMVTGNSSRVSRYQGDSWSMRDASTSSGGIVSSEW
jgi:hypothetical protein